MRLSLSRTIRSSRAVPQWLLAHVRLLAQVPHLIPLEDVAPPVWRLPVGVRATAVALSLVGLVCGVHVLDAQIADLGPEAVIPSVTSAQDVPDENSPPAPLEPTALILEKDPPGT